MSEKSAERLIGAAALSIMACILSGAFHAHTEPAALPAAAASGAVLGSLLVAWDQSKRNSPRPRNGV